MRSRLSQLSGLMAVAEEGQISRAARKLNVTQAALSRSLAHLESELGLELLVRGPRGVSLTPAGAAFTSKARRALDAEADAVQTGAALARAAQGTLLVGFVGPPPSITFPELFPSAGADGRGEVSFQDMPFPRGTTSAWLAGVDVALCVQPRAEEGVCSLPVRIEPRSVVMGAGHRLASGDGLELADVLDETFISFHPLVQPEWTAFHSLDDHRGGPPARVSADGVSTSLQMAATMGATSAITTVPATDARMVQAVMPNLAALPLADAAPAIVCLVWREENLNPLLEGLLDRARELQRAAGDGV
jgi:DNA-binding transcriptional LysR family regulator